MESEDQPTADDFKAELKALSDCIDVLRPMTQHQAERIVVYLQNKFILHQDFT